MNMFIKQISSVALITAVMLSCGSSNQQTAATLNEAVTENTNDGKVYFSCTVNETPLTYDEDGGIFDPVTQMLLNSGENDDYTVGIRIPPGLKAGQTCTGCKGFVHKKIKHEGGIVQRKIYELVQNISLTLTSRKTGYAAGSFSFTVKLKEDSDEIITVTNGKFGMNIINDRE